MKSWNKAGPKVRGSICGDSLADAERSVEPNGMNPDGVGTVNELPPWANASGCGANRFVSDPVVLPVDVMNICWFFCHSTV